MLELGSSERLVCRWCLRSRRLRWLREGPQLLQGGRPLARASALQLREGRGAPAHVIDEDVVRDFADPFRVVVLDGGLRLCVRHMQLQAVQRPLQLGGIQMAGCVAVPREEGFPNMRVRRAPFLLDELIEPPPQPHLERLDHHVSGLPLRPSGEVHLTLGATCGLCSNAVKLLPHFAPVDVMQIVLGAPREVLQQLLVMHPVGSLLGVVRHHDVRFLPAQREGEVASRSPELLSAQHAVLIGVPLEEDLAHDAELRASIPAHLLQQQRLHPPDEILHQRRHLLGLRNLIRRQARRGARGVHKEAGRGLAQILREVGVPDLAVAFFVIVLDQRARLLQSESNAKRATCLHELEGVHLATGVGVPMQKRRSQDTQRRASALLHLLGERHAKALHHSLHHAAALLLAALLPQLLLKAKRRGILDRVW
mmetsp:Transcript_18291/g.69312  ORF Transcript_18291/g.69312 Transcript_18291/m.69312 type:complete len:424 (+) Transcript_18291:840-2111(+)